MKTRTVFVVMTLLLGISSVSAHGQRVVPVHEEPRHQLMAESGPVQVLDVRIPAGDTTLFHTHDAPIHYVLINASGTNAQVLGGDWPRTSGTNLVAGREVGDGWWSLEYARQPLTHRVANTGAGLFRLIAVTNRGPGVADSSARAQRVALLPGTLEAESQWFRRYRLSLQPGATAQWQNSNAIVVAIQVTAGRTEVRGGDDVSKSTTAIGNWLLLGRASPYTLRNAGDSPVVVVLVQALK